MSGIALGDWAESWKGWELESERKKEKGKVGWQQEKTAEEPSSKVSNPHSGTSVLVIPPVHRMIILYMLKTRVK